MKRFEYQVTKHPADNLIHLVYFCSDRGECSPEHVPSDQTDILVNLLNDRGADGWELVQTFFGKDGR
ncbi:MAG: hypothetical protein DRH37_02040 [Deltaproteobacteria bacterium]|nr:MAG: hypothetical protein DRH37_02040 [Deltaproteobacteria bacterium]